MPGFELTTPLFHLSLHRPQVGRFYFSFARFASAISAILNRFSLFATKLHHFKGGFSIYFGRIFIIIFRKV